MWGSSKVWWSRQCGGGEGERKREGSRDAQSTGRHQEEAVQRATARASRGDTMESESSKAFLSHLK